MVLIIESDRPHKLQTLEMVYDVRITCEHCDSLEIHMPRGLNITIKGNCPNNRSSGSSNDIISTPTSEYQYGADDPPIQ
jgi:hypothetical protein